MVLVLAGFGYAVNRAGVLPGWLAATAYVVAVINAAFVPSMYFGPDETGFYTALGWGNTALTASLLGYWAGAAGIAVLRQPQTSARHANPPSTPPR
jgi:hypothetical protein